MKLVLSLSKDTGIDDTKGRLVVMLRQIAAQTLTRKGVKEALAARRLPLSVARLRELASRLAYPLDSAAVLRPLRKLGIRTDTDLVKHANSLYQSVSESDPAWVSSAFITKCETFIADNYTIRLRFTKRIEDITKRAIPAYAYTLATAYTYVALKLCALVGVPASRSTAVAWYLVSGKGRIPEQLKALLKAEASTIPAEAAVPDTLVLDKVTPALVKKLGDELVLRLPALYKAYIKANTKPSKAKPRLDVRGHVIKTISKGLTLSPEDKQREAIVNNLEAAVGAEVFSFFRLVIPALRKYIPPSVILKRKAIQFQLHSTYRSSTSVVKARLETKLAALKQEPPKVAKWMVPYLDASTDIVIEGKRVKVDLDDGILNHRLVQRANGRKLKEDSTELSATLDETGATLLTLAGVDNIIDNLGSVRAFTSVFKNVVSLIKPRAFVIAVNDQLGRSLDTQLGRVSSRRLLTLNGITKEDERVIREQYKKEIAAWKPEKQDVADAVKSLSLTKKVVNSAYTVRQVDANTLKVWQAEMQDKMAGCHNVKITIEKGWEVTGIPATLKAVLKNTAKSSKLRVIPNAFHGTAKQTGSVILHCGFKVKGTQVTGRAMGDVLYIAPNIDKSAQYLSSSGFSRSGYGIIFVGDAIVSGTPQRMIRNEKTAPFAWTHTASFKTHEIGLSDPNKQFVIRRAYLVRTERDSNPPATAVGLKPEFEQQMSVKSYLAKYKPKLK